MRYNKAASEGINKLLFLGIVQLLIEFNNTFAKRFYKY